MRQTYRSGVANAFSQGHGLGFQLDLQFVSQHGPAVGVRAEGSCAISLREAQSHQASVALFIEWIEAQPAGHGLDGALPIPRPFVQQRQDIKELVNAQVPVLAVLACPVVEELRVAQREAGQERTVGLARGLLKLCQQCFMRLACQRFNPAPYLLAGRFDEAEIQDERTALIESKCIALNQQVSPLAWSVRALKELAQLEQGSP